MGVFLHVAVFKKQNEIDIQEVVGQLAEGDNACMIVPEECSVYDCEAGTVLGLNDFCLAYDRAAKVLSQMLEGPVLVCDIHDDSFWDYYLYKEGRELDKFMTVPDCLEEIPDEEWERWRGNAALLAEEFGCAAEPLSEYLRFWGEDGGDAWEMMDFLEALGFTFPCDDDTFEEQQSADGQKHVNDIATAIPGDGQESDADEIDFKKTPDAKNAVDLAADVKVDTEITEWVRVCEGGAMRQFAGRELTSEQIVQMMDETLSGRYSYFAADFVFQGEGVYVKRFKKKVYRPFHSTLVLHQGAGNLACLFFAGDSLCCYELIGDLNAYCNVDIQDLRMLSVGNVMLAEDVVFQERSGIDRALRMLFSDLESADRRLADSSAWSAQIAFPGGINNYNRRRRELGLLED